MINMNNKGIFSRVLSCHIHVLMSGSLILVKEVSINQLTVYIPQVLKNKNGLYI